MVKRPKTDEPFAHPDLAPGATERRPRAVMETRVFKSGNSYAVRLPKVLYAGGESPVYVRKLEDGRLLITPKRKRRWPTGFFDTFGAMPEDFDAPARPQPKAAAERRAASRLRGPT